MSQASAESTPVESVDQLVEFLRGGEKPPEQWRVGTEHEKIGLYTGSWAPVPYEGDRGIGALLRRIADREGWEPVFEGEHPIALTHEGASITLEPGGQFELSGAPLRTIHETCDEFHTHLTLMKELCEPLGIVFLGLGINPLYPVSEIPVMPKARYEIMRSYLPGQGSLALEMMFATATVQANFDFASETDMIAKLRTALAISPVVSAIFANSSLSEGKANGFVSRRIHAWQHTDPDRTGMLDLAFAEDFGYRRYVEWALDVPMFFVIRDGAYRRATHLTFRQFAESGFEGSAATLADFDRHLTTLFPEVRLKRFLEVRGADAVPPGLHLFPPRALEGAPLRRPVAPGGLGPRGLPPGRGPGGGPGRRRRRGLAARYGEEPIIEVARDLVRLAGEGLARIAHAGRRDADETGFLDPIHEQLAMGRSPGQVVVERWEGDWQRSVDRLIEYAQY